MTAQEKKKLKLFLETYLPDFYEMKIVGFFPKGTRKTDYLKIAERYCLWFGYVSIYEYRPMCKGKNCDGKFCDRASPLCPSYPRGRFHPSKWERLKPPTESDLNFIETFAN